MFLPNYHLAQEPKARIWAFPTPRDFRGLFEPISPEFRCSGGVDLPRQQSRRSLQTINEDCHAFPSLAINRSVIQHLCAIFRLALICTLVVLVFLSLAPKAMLLRWGRAGFKFWILPDSCTSTPQTVSRACWRSNSRATYYWRALPGVTEIDPSCNHVTSSTMREVRSSNP